MWIENKVFEEDLKYITTRHFIHWNQLEGTTVLVTGGTGLIGSYIINSCLYYNKTHSGKIAILALVRNLDKAKEMYRAQIVEDGSHLIFIPGSVEKLPQIKYHVDYIVHCAAPTASAFFAEKPVETIQISVLGTMNILKMATEKKIKSMVYLSSMEVYGPIHQQEKVNEKHPSYLETMIARNSYPESKRLCETLCSSFFSEYQVPVNCIRLTQTFGPGIAYDDQRVFAMFIRSCIEKKDIVLLTEGKTCRNYLYLADAASAILTVLTSESRNQVYNAANEETYCSIREMANFVAEKIANNEIKVKVQLGNAAKTKNFMPELFMDLDATKLRKLNWSPHFGLAEIFQRTVKSLVGK